MAHIKKVYHINSEIPIEEFSEILLNSFAKKCENTRINVVKQTNSEITFKGPLFRYTGSSFHYLNGITCGKLEIKKQEKIEEEVADSYIVERTFCYKETMLMSLAFTILPIWLFIIPLFEEPLIDPHYHLEIAKNIYDINWGFIGLFIIWGVFFAGNILWTSIQFSKFIQSIRTKIMEDYILEKE